MIIIFFCIGQIQHILVASNGGQASAAAVADDTLEPSDESVESSDKSVDSSDESVDSSDESVKSSDEFVEPRNRRIIIREVSTTLRSAHPQYTQGIYL